MKSAVDINIKDIEVWKRGLHFTPRNLKSPCCRQRQTRSHPTSASQHSAENHIWISKQSVPSLAQSPLMTLRKWWNGLKILICATSNTINAINAINAQLAWQKFDWNSGMFSNCYILTHLLPDIYHKTQISSIHLGARGKNWAWPDNPHKYRFRVAELLSWWGQKYWVHRHLFIQNLGVCIQNFPVITAIKVNHV